MADDEATKPPTDVARAVKDFPGMAPWTPANPHRTTQSATESVTESAAESTTASATESAAEPVDAASMMSPKAQPRRKPGRARTWTAALTIAALIIAGLAVGLYFYLSTSGKPGPATVAVVSTPAATPGQQPSPSVAAPTPVKMQTQTFGDWIVGCPADQSGPCTAQQRLVSSSGQAALVWSMQRDAKGVLHALWLLPTGIVLTRGMTLDVGDGKPSAIPFSSCDARGCYARAVIAADYLQKLEAATTLTASVVIEATGKSFSFTLSPRGLSDAVASLTPAK
jgi:invasion protein IalB